MSNEVQAVNTKTAMMRVLETPVDTPATPDSWFTPEFVSMVSTVVVNLLTAATILGWVDARNAQELASAVTGIITALGAVSVNGLVVWKYLAGRAVAKSAEVTAKYQYMASVETNRMMAAMEQQRIEAMTAKPAPRRRKGS
jgi:hypothetical protein